MRRILPFFAIFAVASCGPVSSGSNEVSVWKTISECLESQNGMLCAKEKALKITDRLRSLKQLEIVEGVVLSNTEPSRTARSNDISSSDPSTREAQIEEKIIDNVEDLLDNVVLQFKLPGASDDEETRQFKEGFGGGSKKGGGKKNKGKEMLSLILKTKLFALIPVFLAIIAITLLKKIIMAKIAFFVIAIVLLKTLLAKKHSHSSHEVWAAPVAIHGGHHGGHGGWEGWDRTKAEASNMAYGSHTKS